MIQFNVTPRRTIGHRSTEPLIERTSRWWRCADARLAEYGDVALAVERNIVTGGFLINGYTRDPAEDNKVILDLSPLPGNHPAAQWITRDAPVAWQPGQRQPFKYISWRGLIPVPPPINTPQQIMGTTA